MTVLRRFQAFLPHQIATRHLSGTVSVAEQRDYGDGTGRFYVVVYRSAGGRWQSGRVSDPDQAYAAAIILAEFLGCDLADLRL